MGFTECSKYLRFTFVMLIASVIFLVFGIALPYWYQYEYITEKSDTVRIEFGLWQYCNVTFTTTKCADITGDMAEDWLKMSRILLMLCLVLIVVDVVIVSIVLFKKNESKMIRIVALLISLLTCGLFFTGVTVYAVKQQKEDGKLSGSFGITVVSLVFAVGGSVLSLLDLISLKT